MIHVQIGQYKLVARLEKQSAPLTCDAFLQLLPLSGQMLQARWSGQAGFVPLGGLRLEVGPENATSYPAPGQLLLYPAVVSETEILIPYGPTCFSSKAGQLAGNHFLTIVEGLELMPLLGDMVWRQGVLDIDFRPVQ